MSKKKFILPLSLCLLVIGLYGLYRYNDHKKLEKYKNVSLAYMVETCSIDKLQNIFKTDRLKDEAALRSWISEGKLQSAIIDPLLALKLEREKAPLKLRFLRLGDVSKLIVSKKFSSTDLKDLKGQRVAINSRYSMQHLLLRQLLKEKKMGEGDLVFLEVPSIANELALANGEIGAYITNLKLEDTSHKLLLAMAYPSCVLVTKANDANLDDMLNEYFSHLSEWKELKGADLDRIENDAKNVGILL